MHGTSKGAADLMVPAKDIRRVETAGDAVFVEGDTATEGKCGSDVPVLINSDPTSCLKGTIIAVSVGPSINRRAELMTCLVHECGHEAAISMDVAGVMLVVEYDNVTVHDHLTPLKLIMIVVPTD